MAFGITFILLALIIKPRLLSVFATIFGALTLLFSMYVGMSLGIESWQFWYWIGFMAIVILIALFYPFGKHSSKS